MRFACKTRKEKNNPLINVIFEQKERHFVAKNIELEYEALKEIQMRLSITKCSQIRYEEQILTTKWIRGSDWTLVERITMSISGSFLNWATYFQAVGSLAKISSSLKPNQHYLVELVKILDTHGTFTCQIPIDFMNRPGYDKLYIKHNCLNWVWKYSVYFFHLTKWNCQLTYSIVLIKNTKLVTFRSIHYLCKKTHL